MVAAAYVIATVGTAAWVLVADAGTFRPAACDGCPGPLVSLGSDPELARSLVAGQRGVAALLTVAIVIVMAKHWRRGSLGPTPSAGTCAVGRGVHGSGDGRQRRRPVAGPGRTSAGACNGRSRSASSWCRSRFSAACLRTRLARAVGVSRLVDQLAALPSPDHLRAALAEALGDRTLSVVYWLPSVGSYVDSAGKPVVLPGAELEPRGDARRGRRTAGRGARPRRRVWTEEASLVRSAGRAAALWLERDRLEVEGAGAHHGAAGVACAARRGGRRRAAADRARSPRRRPASARRAAAARAARAPADGPRRRPPAMLDEIERGLGDALADLRALAAGILPPVLSDHGLEAALEELTSRFPVAVAVERVPFDGSRSRSRWRRTS